MHTGLLAFPFRGAAVGAVAAFKMSVDVVLGSVPGVAGDAATATAGRGPPMGSGTVLIVGICAFVGALMSIGDRLGGLWTGAAVCRRKAGGLFVGGWNGALWRHFREISGKARRSLDHGHLRPDCVLCT